MAGFRVPPDAAEKAQRLAGVLDSHRAHQAKRASVEARKAELRRLVETGADIMQIVPLIAHRHFEILVLHMSGTASQEIAALMHTTSTTVSNVLKRPEIVQMKTLIQKAQLERVIAGDFGARAKARAASGDIMARTIDVASGKRGDVKVSEELRAGETVLKVAGDLGGRDGDSKTKTVHHLHVLMRDLTPAELRRLGETGEWPERYRAQVEALQLPGPDAAAKA